MKKLFVFILIGMMTLTGCSSNNTEQKQTSKVDIYVSDDVDVFGNKIDDKSTSDLTQKETEEDNIDVPEETDTAVYKELKVYFLDVGQADSILLEISDDENILIDGGNASDAEDIINYLNYLGVTHLDSIVATHPHEDHIGGLADIMDNIETDKIYLPYIEEKDIPTTVTYENFLESIENNEIIAIQSENGDKIYESEYATLEIISPDDIEANDLNDYSIVTKLTYGDNSFIFTGDASSEINQQIMNSYPASYLDVDVLKVGHHGSYTATNEKWIKTLSPQHAVIMCGIGNQYGHPHNETIELLNKNNIATYRTDNDGTILMISDGKNITIQTGQTGKVPLGDKNFDITNVQ